MAGRILPVALAVISGVAIGVATFGEEFKEQRRRRLQEEYNRDVAAVSSLNSEGPSPMTSSAIKAPQPEQLSSQAETAQSSKASSVFGFWAWSSKGSAKSAVKEQPTSNTATDATKQQP
ncbi:hypothetical protein N0V90_005757 [Kalmusia sp. IMI 367209]|nr:hypothetical protein N0V90_005757 [Kalmusia sp. IMI 367209]